MKKTSRFFLAITFVLSMVLGGVGNLYAITYGEPDGEQHPYVGFVAFYDSDGQYMWRCTGTLISPTVLLTAGHCTYGTSHARVWFESDLSLLEYPFNADPYSIEGTPIPHPNYDNFATFPNTSDVGVVILDEDVVKAKYGVLPEIGVLDKLSTKRGLQNRLFDVVGYGYLSVKPKLIIARGRYNASSMLINLRNALTDGWNIHLSNNPGQGQGTGGTCFGDSGGPVFISGTNIIVGITSFGLNENCKGVDFSYRIDTQYAEDFINYPYPQ
jgi:hypothetical protein